MKVAFCSLPLRTGHKTRGIGGYTRQLLEALKRQEGVEVGEFGNLSEVQDVDVIHFPFFDLFQNTLSANKKIPTVVTVHDVIPLVYPQHYPVGLRGSWNNFLQKRALNNTAAIITDSQASRRDIVKYLNVSEKKVYVVPLASPAYFKKMKNPKILDEVKNKYCLPEKFALYTGNVNWNKNLINLTEAALQAGIDLVLIGKSFEERENLDHPEMKSFKIFLHQYSDNSKVHILGFVRDEDLVAVTNLASAVLLPSFAEGFGLPILEAQTCGTPVITSNGSSMSEAAGNGALFVDPNSVEDICGAIKMILSQGSVYERLIKDGSENAKKFSWAETARQTVEIYKRVV